MEDFISSYYHLFGSCKTVNQEILIVILPSLGAFGACVGLGVVTLGVVFFGGGGAFVVGGGAASFFSALRTTKSKTI